MAIMINDPFLSKIYSDVIAEIARSEVKHPDYPLDHLRRTAITTEEMLEATLNIVRNALQVARVGNEDRYATIEDLRKELIHASAMCLKQLIRIDHEAKQAHVGEY